MKSALGSWLIGGLILASSPANEAQADAVTAERLLRNAVNQSVRASKLERRGKKQEAIEAYELAGQLSEASMAEAEESGPSPEGRSPEVYYRSATSYLHAGRLLAQLRQEGERKEENLRRAVNYLETVEKIELERAQRTNSPINPEVWRVRNAAAYACFLRGELAQARTHYQDVLEMNPTYKPAQQAIAEINKIEQQENGLFTPQGDTRAKERNLAVFRSIIDTLRLVRDVATLGR